MCDSCEVLSINGVTCHETGCPDAWKDYQVECAWCGTEFTPEYDGQTLCDESCAASYHGLPYEDEYETEEEDQDYETRQANSSAMCNHMQ